MEVERTVKLIEVERYSCKIRQQHQDAAVVTCARRRRVNSTLPVDLFTMKRPRRRRRSDVNEEEGRL